MRTIPVWIDKVRDSNKIEQCIYDLCFNPCGSHLIVATGPVVSVYDCSNGSVIEALKGHKENVHCVAYSHDGARFASGGADKVVIIWTSKLEPLLKYVHTDAIQCLEFNPVTNVLVSCASSDFSFWSVDQKSVQKFKTPSRINSCSWNSLGQYLALGLANGNVSVRNPNGDEKFFIDREGPPIWALCFSPRREESDVLCVSDWSQKMTFYSIEDKEIGRERHLGFEALSVSYMPTGDYILVGGCSKQCVLTSGEGIQLGTIGKEQESWVWSCKAHPTAPYVVFGCQDGTLAYFQLTFSTVHDLYRETYAFRERNMTDVVVQHLLTNERVRIECRKRVDKIAVYKDRLAVLFPTRVVVYERGAKDSANEIHYQIKAKLEGSFDCNLLVVCSAHLAFCQDEKLRCFTFDGENVGQWSMSDVVRYVKVVGGAPGNEGLVVGLDNGQVLKIYLKNAFAIPIMRTGSAVHCIDVSLSRRKVAVINKDRQCTVFDMVQNSVLHQEAKVTGVAWNNLLEDMLCFSGSDVLSVKMDDCPPYRMKFKGVVVAAFGSRAYSLTGSNVVVVDIPLSTPMYQCIEKQMCNAAYRVACLGVTENDWRALARAAVEGGEHRVAIHAFARVKDLQRLQLVHDFLVSDEKRQESFLGELLAYDGKFKEAARMFLKSGENQRAVTMYSDMRMFDQAQDMMKSENNADKKSLIRKKAEWAKNVNEPKAAAEIYLSAGDAVRAVDIAVENGWTNMLADMAKKLDSVEVEALRKIAHCFRQHGRLEEALEIYKKLGEHESILRLLVDARMWQSAFAFIDEYPQYQVALYTPYARWLVENDQFVEAQRAFCKAGAPAEASKVVRTLIENAADENRFDDAGYYHWILGRQYLDLARMMHHRREEHVQNFREHDQLANVYYAYHAIHRYLDEPFTSYQPEALFNIARYLLNETKVARPRGVARFPILYSLAKQAGSLGGYKIARQALDVMQNLLVPSHLQDYVDLSAITMKAKPYHDNEELLVMCYRCSSYSPLVVSASSTAGNSCLNCRQPFVFSFVTFEILPLIEFQLADGIGDEEALQLLLSSNDDAAEGRTIAGSDATFQTLLIEDNPANSYDLFSSTLVDLEMGGGKHKPVVVDRETLLSLDSSLVIVCQQPEPLRYRFFKNLVPELQMSACSSCFRIFHVDDFELEVLQKGFCPFCRVAPAGHVSLSRE